MGGRRGLRCQNSSISFPLANVRKGESLTPCRNANFKKAVVKRRTEKTRKLQKHRTIHVPFWEEKTERGTKHYGIRNP